MNPGDFTKLRRELVAQDFTIELTGSNTWKVIPPDPSKSIVIVSAISNGRSATWNNILADLRRCGFHVGGVAPPKRLPAPSGHVEQQEAPSETPVKRGIVTEPTTMDRVWADLKEARMYVGLVDEAVKVARDEHDRAKRELEKNEAERAVAEDALRKAKAAFDQVFTP